MYMHLLCCLTQLMATFFNFVFVDVLIILDIFYLFEKVFMCFTVLEKKRKGIILNSKPEHKSWSLRSKIQGTSAHTRMKEPLCKELRRQELSLMHIRLWVRTHCQYAYEEVYTRITYQAKQPIRVRRGEYAYHRNQPKSPIRC